MNEYDYRLGFTHGYMAGARAERLQIASDISHELGTSTLKECYEAIKNREMRKIKSGKWIENDNGTFSCNQCQSWIPKEQHRYARYCLYCGATMKDEKPTLKGKSFNQIFIDDFV